ncbi:MAG: citrate/2-methylcitrate synthase [Chloroflexales bacterium]|nr:citrate/2-methylcitrate synthase [Chloroflexales bacterium]
MTTGLSIDGIILGQTRLGAVDGAAGQLSFCGYDLHDLVAYACWEEVAYLLWYGDLPTPRQLDDLRERLAAARDLTDAELALLRASAVAQTGMAALPFGGHAMDALCAAILALAQLQPSPPMRADTILDAGLHLTAKLPTILTTIVRLRESKEPVTPDPRLDHASNFLLTLHGTPPDEAAARALNAYLVLMAENGLNISTFVARVVTSTQNDLYTAITAAISTLKGLAHGGANEYAMRTFLAIGSPERAADYIAELLARRERLMGVGHRVFEVEDPRVRHMRRLSAQLAEHSGAHPSAQSGCSHAIAVAVEKVIQEHPFFRQRKLYPNVEFYSASLLDQLGLPLDCFTAVFACARMPGWVAHIREQLADNRLVRPEAAYIGPARRQFVPLEQRH